MESILSQVSSIIVAGTNVSDHQMFDGIRNLANMSLISYPKSRVLQIILDPRIIAKDAALFAEKCADVKFSEIRNQIIHDLSKFIPGDVLIMLKKFSHGLLDNDEVLHIHVGDSSCASDRIHPKPHEIISSLYEKCTSFGLPHGYLNLYSHSMLTRLVRSKQNIIQAIVNYTDGIEVFKSVMHLCSVDYYKVKRIVKIISAMDKKVHSFDYLMQLPDLVLEVLEKGIGLNKHSYSLTHEKIEEILRIYRTNYSLFTSISLNPILSKLIVTHANLDVMSAFLDIICYNDRRINEINKLTTKLSSFLFSYLSGEENEENENAKALIELAKISAARCMKIITNAPIIKKMQLKISLVCELASGNVSLFDALFSKYHHDLHLLEDLRVSSAVKNINDLVEMLLKPDSSKTKELFTMIHKEG